MKFVKRLLRQVPEARSYLAITILVGTVSGSLIVFQARYLSQIINGVFLLLQAFNQVWDWFLFLLFTILVRALLTWIGALVANQIAGWIKTKVRAKLLSHLFLLGPVYIRGERSGELINTIVEGVEALDPYFSQYLPQLFLSVIVPAVITFTILFTDIPSAIILLIMAPILFFLMAIAGMMAGAETRRHWQALSLMSAHFLDTLQGLTTLKLLGRSEEEADNVRRVSDRFRQTTMSTLRIAFFSSFILEEGATISTAIVAVEVGLRLLLGQVSFQTALFVLLLTPEFFAPLRLLAAKYHAGMTGSVAVQRIIDILETPASQPVSREHPLKRRKTDMVIQDGIRLENVSYSYDGQRPALHNVSFQIAPGQKVALVGPSGAGKSTIAHLLLRFIEADSGTLSIEGKTFKEIPAQDSRKQIAWVPQHPYLFNATVAENIRLGYPHATTKQIREAAQDAHIDEFITKLPQGYDTIIGEQGSRLSGGEAQRISLARAFLKDAPLLILDEATSYLDPEYESQVLESLARLEQGRTVLIIAHRLSTVYNADQIVVLDEGCVVEVGTHQSLLQQSGLYRQLINTYQKRNA